MDQERKEKERKRSQQVVVIKVNRIQENQIDATLQQMWKIAATRDQKVVQSSCETVSESFDFN